MSDEPASAVPPTPPATPSAERPPAGAATVRGAGAGAGFGLIAAWLIAGVALVAVVLLWQRVSSMQEQLARQSAEAGSRSFEARTLAQQADAQARDNTGKLAALEGRVNDLAAYRAQMEELVQTVARARDENLAVDLDAALRLAQDQTQLTGSVQPLLAALRTAEQRLARSTDPRLAPVARAVARDLQRVKSAAIPDTAALLARIDQLLRQVDELPVGNDVGRAHRGAAREAPAPAPAGWWERVARAVLDDAHELLRVSRVARPEATMLSPEQAFFVRENLKLRLQGARLAILARQYEAARADLAAASTSLGSWFDPAARRTQAAATLLQQIQGATRGAELPRLDDTLVALGNAVAARDRGVTGSR